MLIIVADSAHVDARVCMYYVCAARAGGWYDDAKWYDTLAYTVRQSRQRVPGGRSKIREWV